MKHGGSSMLMLFRCRKLLDERVNGGGFSWNTKPYRFGIPRIVKIRFQFRLNDDVASGIGSSES